MEYKIKESLSKIEEYSQNESLGLVINEMLEGTENENENVFDPLNENPIQLMKKIIRSKSIKHPKNAFQSSITQNSRIVLNEHLRLLQIGIMSATNREEYHLVKYKLDELLFLKENLKEENIEQIFEDCINHVLRHANQEYTNTITSFNSYLDKRNTLSSKDVDFYKPGKKKTRGKTRLYASCYAY